MSANKKGFDRLEYMDNILVEFLLQEKTICEIESKKDFKEVLL